MSDDREKIRKVLAMIEGAKTEGEAQAASLALQRLLAKTGLDMSEVEAGNSEVKEYGAEFSKAASSNWKTDLAVIIAENYRCETYLRVNPDGSRVAAFIGQGDDARIAAECFIATERAAERCFRQRCRKMRDKHPNFDPTRASARNGYYYGFCGGLMQAYEEQLAGDEELALALQVPAEVRKAKERHNLRAPKKTKVSMLAVTYQQGHTDGYEYGKEGQ